MALALGWLIWGVILAVLGFGVTVVIVNIACDIRGDLRNAQRRRVQDDLHPMRDFDRARDVTGRLS